MHFAGFAKVASVVSVAGTILASCVVVEEGPGMRPPPPLGPPPGRGEICTREYAPVCGERRGERQTFGNGCVANAEGFRIVHPGECRRETGWQREPQACTREYRPVCAERRGERRTFGNACTAEAEGYQPIRPGECGERPGGRWRG